MSFFYIFTDFVVFLAHFIGFCWFAFDFHKIVIGKSTFIGYNVKKEFFIFYTFSVKLQQNPAFLSFNIHFIQKRRGFYVNYV